MGQSIDEILGKVKPPVRSVWVCLDGELWSRHDELSRDIAAARAEGPAAKMGDTSRVGGLVAELQQVEQAMRDAEVEFKFRGVSAYKRDAIIAKYPARDGRGWDTTAGAHELFAAAAVDPVMTEEQARKLVEATHYGAVAKLFNCAWGASEGSTEVPFFARAFASTTGSE